MIQHVLHPPQHQSLPGKAVEEAITSMCHMCLTRATASKRIGALAGWPFCSCVISVAKASPAEPEAISEMPKPDHTCISSSIATSPAEVTARHCQPATASSAAPDLLLPLLLSLHCILASFIQFLRAHPIPASFASVASVASYASCASPFYPHPPHPLHPLLPLRLASL